MNELDVVKKLGVACSTEIKEILDKSIVAVIRQLSSFEKTKQIRIVYAYKTHGIRRLYMTNEIYKNMFNNEE